MRHLLDINVLIAVEKHGCLATFDQHIPLDAVPNAGATHLRVI